MLALPLFVPVVVSPTVWFGSVNRSNNARNTRRSCDRYGTRVTAHHTRGTYTIVSTDDGGDDSSARLGGTAHVDAVLDGSGPPDFESCIGLSKPATAGTGAGAGA